MLTLELQYPVSYLLNCLIQAHQELQDLIRNCAVSTIDTPQDPRFSLFSSRKVFMKEELNIGLRANLFNKGFSNN